VSQPASHQSESFAAKHRALPTLPFSWYFDSTVAALEQELVFQRAWQLAAPVGAVDAPGDVFACRVAGAPIVLTRDVDRALRGFVNVCRHRGHPVAEKEGSRSTLQCPYHAWTYGLDGSLQRAPRSEADPSFDARRLSLVPVRLAEALGFVFVSLDPDVAPFDEVYPELGSLAGDREIVIEDYEYLSRATATVSGNWKLWVENACECYHCPTIHSASFSQVWNVASEAYDFFIEGRVIGQFARRRDDGLDRPAATLRQLYLWPGSFLSADGRIAYAGTIVPDGPDQCTIITHTFVHRAANLDSLPDTLQMYEATFAEDAAAVEAQHEAIRCGLVERGNLLSPSEDALAHVQRLTADALDGAVRSDAAPPAERLPA
jgi:phenylpropionate dioxygenase-like ring-hydroxylating dioxygenase large terminal subunit